MVAVIVIPLIVAKGFAESKMFISAGICVIVLAGLNYFVKMPDTVKAVLFAILPGTVIFTLFFLDGFALNKHYFIFITIVMAAICFDC